METTCRHCNSKLILDSRSLLVCQNKDCDFKSFSSKKRKRYSKKYGYKKPNIEEWFDQQKGVHKFIDTIRLIIIWGFVLILLYAFMQCDNTGKGGYDEYDPYQNDFRWW